MSYIKIADLEERKRKIEAFQEELRMVGINNIRCTVHGRIPLELFDPLTYTLTYKIKFLQDGYYPCAAITELPSLWNCVYQDTITGRIIKPWQQR